MYPMNQWPEYVQICFETLRQAGHQAYLVGGCVRDLVLGRRPDDYDMATDALPEQVMTLFPRTYPTGLRHGTVTAALDGGSIEVTTFRTEDRYSDGRHPDGVRFVSSLKEDLSRRDFTMNAMALGEDGTLHDPFRGRADLEAGLIRCVGEAERRFREDGLRMFRGLRFAAQLGFALEEETGRAIGRCARQAGTLSAERVRTEVEKLICARLPQRGGAVFSSGLMDRWLPRQTVDLTGLTRLEPEALERWAGLCALLEAEPGPLLRGLKAEKRLTAAEASGWRLWKGGLPADRYGWRKALSDAGVSGCRAAAAMGDVSAGAFRADLDAVLHSGACWTVGGLALSGGELRELGFSGPAIGQVQKQLLELVLRCPEKNTPEQLRAQAEYLHQK